MFLRIDTYKYRRFHRKIIASAPDNNCFFAQVALAQQSKTDPSLEFNPHWFGQMTVSGSGSAVNSFKVKQNGAALSSPFYTVCLPD